MSILRLDTVSLSYGPIQAVVEASFSVQSGQIVALVGANGAGKTTLLKSIAGLMLPSHGSINFDNKDVTRLPVHRRVQAGIALSPEGRQVFPNQSVLDNLELGAYARHLDRSALAGRLSEQFNLFPRLRERAAQPAVTLSGGEQQMLAMARALMSRPRLLLLDEPSLGLAPLIIKEIFSIIRLLRDRGVTILLVEQMANLALSIADQAYVIETGRIVLRGTGPELLSNRQVQAAYLGTTHSDASRMQFSHDRPRGC